MENTQYQNQEEFIPEPCLPIEVLAKAGKRSREEIAETV